MSELNQAVGATLRQPRGERLDEEFRAVMCGACMPDDPNDDWGDLDHTPSPYAKPYVWLLPMDEPAPDFCPRCGDRLGTDEIETGVVLRKWA